MNNLNFANPKIVTIESLINKLTKNKTGKTIVTTNGCFDILHPGHIKFLENAKALGDILVVAVNSDSSIRAIKGNKRPIIKQMYRAYALSALKFTDFIVIFEETTPIDVLKRIKPNIHVKGLDYQEKELPESPVLKELGSKIVLLPLLSDFSTSNLLQKLEHY